MKVITGILVLAMIVHHAAYCQNNEMKKFYAYYKVSGNTKKACDSIYHLIEQRRAAFSKTFKEYKEKKGSPDGFTYDWSVDENNILLSLESVTQKYLTDLVYYSYFDLAYGIYGLHLKPEICRLALKKVEPSSPVWAMEPSLLGTVIKYAGGEDKYTFFIKELLKKNKDANLSNYIKESLSPDRPLKIGKILPELYYRNFLDTMQVLSTNIFRGKYLLIDIWATWCKPCLDEFPRLQKVYTTRNKDLEFLSISIDRDAITPLKFLEKTFAIPWQKGLAIKSENILGTLMISGIPCTILVSPKGRILSYGYDMRGEALEKTLLEKIKPRSETHL